MSHLLYSYYHITVSDSAEIEILNSSSSTHMYVLIALIALSTCLCTYVVHNVFLHPLSAVPGPRLYATYRLPYIWCVVTGRLAVRLHQLHERYGPVVRTASNEVSFAAPAAWEIIYAKKNTSRHEFPKNYDTWNETANNFTKTLFLASDEDHPRMRKVLSPAFSDRMLHDNEPLLRRHVDKFLEGIEIASRKEAGDASTAFQRPVDINDWFN